MKTRLSVVLALCAFFTSFLYANNPLRKEPYPQQNDIIYLNPAPLLVPVSMKGSDYLQFNLPRDKTFRGKDDIMSRPVRWCMFNPHRTLNAGIWYWRFCSVSKSGEEMPWSKTYSFTVEEETPRFVTPAFDVFLNNIPQNYPRIYCFLNGHLEEARKNVRYNPEFEHLIDDSRRALAMNFRTDSEPYKHVMAMSENFDNLNTAYQMLQNDIYAKKTVENVRCLLTEESVTSFIENDFNAGELVYLLAGTLTTVNGWRHFKSVARIFCEQQATITQTDKYAAPPNQAIAQRGEDFTPPWSLTASFGPCKKNRILTVIQVEADGNQAVEIVKDGNKLQCDDWIIEAELDSGRPASLYIRNTRNQAAFSYGIKKPDMNGVPYSCKEKDASVLFDRINGKWEIQEMGNQRVQRMGKW